MHFLPQKSFLTQISKRSTPTDLHHPPLHLAQFFSLESLKISSAYAKISLGLKMEKFLQTICEILASTYSPGPYGPGLWFWTIDKLEEYSKLNMLQDYI